MKFLIAVAVFLGASFLLARARKPGDLADLDGEQNEATADSLALVLLDDVEVEAHDGIANVSAKLTSHRAVFTASGQVVLVISTSADVLRHSDLPKRAFGLLLLHDMAQRSDQVELSVSVPLEGAYLHCHTVKVSGLQLDRIARWAQASLARRQDL